MGYDCVPTDAPMEPSPDGQAWKCAWANREHAGVWYTGEDILDGLSICDGLQVNGEVKKLMKNGVLYIQRAGQIYDVTGRCVRMSHLQP